VRDPLGKLSLIHKMIDLTDGFTPDPASRRTLKSSFIDAHATGKPYGQQNSYQWPVIR
jgi:hypothetical protein